MFHLCDYNPDVMSKNVEYYDRIRIKEGILMDAKMFCFQCEQTAGCTGCTGAQGVCGKSADTAKLQYELTGALMQILIPQLCWGEWSKQGRAGCC